MTRGRWLRTVLRGLAVVAVLLAVVAVRVVTSSHGELSEGDRLSARDDTDGAILAYRRAARFYAPGNPYSTEALDRLAAIAEDADAAGETERALAAWRSVRGAILATRSVYVPHGDRLARAETAIADLRAREGATRERASLEAPTRPKPLWAVVALLGWLGWTFGAFVFAQKALDEEDRVVPAAARLWGTVVVLAFGVFVIGLALA